MSSQSRPAAAALRRGVLAAAGVAVVLAAWQASAMLWFTNPSGTSGAVPPPSAVFVRVIEDLAEPVYWRALGATVSSATLGFAAGVVVAIALGVVVVLVPWLDLFATRIGVIAACLPAAAIAPLIVLLTPVGSRTVSVVLAALAVLFPAIIGVLLGLRAATVAQVDLIKAYGGSAFTVIRKVRSVAAIPAVLSALKIGAPSAVLGAIVGEFFVVGVDSGAGLLLVSHQYVGDYAGMWAIAMLCTIAAATGYLLVAGLGRGLAPWTAHGLQERG